MFRRLLRRDPSVLYRHRWLALCTGFQGEPYVVATPGVLIVPINAQGEVLFIVEPSRVDGSLVLSLPSGATDDHTPAEAADHELQEEIGYKAGRLDYLGELSLLPRHGIWQNTVFLARDLTPQKLEGDEGYPISIEPTPFAEFESLIRSGRLTGAPLIAALYMARSFIEREGR